MRPITRELSYRQFFNPKAYKTVGEIMKRLEAVKSQTDEYSQREADEIRYYLNHP